MSLKLWQPGARINKDGKPEAFMYGARGKGKWVFAKEADERIAALAVDIAQLKADLADRDAHYMDVLGSYDALKAKLARMEAPLTQEEFDAQDVMNPITDDHLSIEVLFNNIIIARAKGGTNV